MREFRIAETGLSRDKEDLAKIKNADPKEVIKKQMSELKTKWPHCTLLCESTRKQ